jgi:hypothetical protein
MLDSVTLRLPVEVTTSDFAALALLTLTFSDLSFFKPSKLDSLFAKPHQVVLSSSQKKRRGQS